MLSPGRVLLLASLPIAILLSLLLLLALLSLPVATSFLLGPFLVVLILISLICLLLIFLALFLPAAAATLSVGDATGADQHCQGKRCRGCEGLVINFH